MSIKKGNNKITLEEFIEEQRKFNKLIDKKNRQNRKTIIFMIIFSIILSGITGVASYSLAANQVGYTAKDATWEVENTEEAIDDLYSSVGSALVGSIYSYMGNNAPFGYLACDGTEYNIADYPRLAAHFNKEFGSANYFGGDGTTTFAVPDLRGEFLRGTGTNSHADQGSGETVGVHQDGTMHLSVGKRSNGGDLLYVTSIDDSNVENKDSLLTNKTKNATTYTKYGTSIYGQYPFTSRPTNTSVLYIIKY